MGFHESYWIVAGTAAPIIVLAAIVAARDAISPSVPRNKRSVRRASVAYLAAGYNMLGQTFVLGWSLWSLSYQRNEVLPVLPSVIETLGILALMISAVAMRGAYPMTAVEDDESADQSRTGHKAEQEDRDTTSVAI